MNAQSDPGSAPAGWYQDPAGRHQYRCWDGSAWTDIVLDNGRQSIDPLAQLCQPQMCENCQALSSSGKTVIYYAGEQCGVIRAGLVTIAKKYRPLLRSSVFLCEQCARSGVKTKAAIDRKLASSGHAGATHWDCFGFFSEFGNELLKNASYIRIGDIMQDDLATPEGAGNATLIFQWNPKRLVGDTPMWLMIDDEMEGFGRVSTRWSAKVHVPAGAHKLSVGLRCRDATIYAEPGATYHVDVVHNRTWGTMGLTIMRVN